MILRITRCSLIIFTATFIFQNFGNATENTHLHIDQHHIANTEILDASIPNSGKSKIRVIRESIDWKSILKALSDIVKTYNETKNSGYECFMKLNDRRNEPILLNSSNNFVLNDGRSGLIRFKKGESFTVSCQNPYILKKITCNKNNIYVDESSKFFSLSKIDCTKNYKTVTRGRNKYLEIAETEKPKNNKSSTFGNILGAFFVGLFAITESALKHFNRSSDCFLLVNYMSDIPLVLHPSDNFLLETDKYGFIDFETGQSYRVSCQNPYMLKTITCKGNRTFVDELSNPFELYPIKCKTNYKPIEKLGKKYLVIPEPNTTQISVNSNSIKSNSTVKLNLQNFTTPVYMNSKNSTITANQTAVIDQPMNVVLEDITTTPISVNSKNSTIKLNQTADIHAPIIEISNSKNTTFQLNQTTDCTTKVKYMRYRPTLLRSTDNYLLEQNRSGFIQLKIGHSYRIACQNPYILETITCKENNTFYDESSNPFILSEIICRGNYRTKTRGGKKYVDIPLETTSTKGVLKDVTTHSNTELQQSTQNILEDISSTTEFEQTTNKVFEDITNNSATELDQTTGCTVDISEIYFDLNIPLYLQNPKDDVIKSDYNGAFNISKGESFRVLCESPNIMKTITCKGNNTLIDETGQPIDKFNEITCTKKYQRVISTRNNCLNGNKELKIGYALPKSVFLPILEICFNDLAKDVLYTKQSLSKYSTNIGVNNWEDNIFSSGELRFKLSTEMNFNPVFFGIDEHLLNDIYDKSKQKVYMNRLLNKPLNSNTYVNPDNNLYIENAPLSFINDDSFLRYSIHFYYVNSAPIWRTIRTGNWIRIKNSIRRFVTIQSNTTNNMYVAYTGTYGRSKIENKEIYLQTIKERKIMFVPEVFWKIIYNENSKEGYVFIVVNNPHLTSYTPICKDSCPEEPPIPINWEKNNATLGFAYCCELADFLNVVPVPI